MKILYHHRTRAGDAQGIHIRALCEAFEALGHSVRVVAPPAGGRSRADGDGQRESRSSSSVPTPAWLYEVMALGYNIPAFFMLSWTILRWRPRFVYERYALYTVAGRVCAMLFRLPFVLEVNAPLSLELRTHGRLTFHGLAQRVEDWLCRSSDRTVVVSEAMRGIFTARGLSRDHFIVMHNGVDRSRFHPGLSGHLMRSRFGLEEACVAGFVGWIRPWHGVDLLIDALDLLRERVPKLRLLIVGDGPAVPDLKCQVQRLCLDEHVLFSGPVKRDAVPEFIAAMDIAVQPDVTDYASPIKLFEYLALGKAVVAPDKPNIAEVVTNEAQALLFTPGDAQSLAAALERLCTLPELRRRLEMAGARLIEEAGYDWLSNARRVLQIVDGDDKEIRPSVSPVRDP